MEKAKLRKLFNNKIFGNIIIFIAVIVFIYLAGSIYFARHFFFNTVINGVDVSFKAKGKVLELIKKQNEAYELELVERNNEIERISGREVGLKMNEIRSVSEVVRSQNGFMWLKSISVPQIYYLESLFAYDEELMKNKINSLKCLNNIIIEPVDVRFEYSKWKYTPKREVFGNKINKDKLIETIKTYILKGQKKLDLNENLCYENPRFTIDSEKTTETLKLLNKYVSTKITYVFGEEKEFIDGDKINQWLKVDENLDVTIDRAAVKKYVQALGEKYDTVGKTRNFETSLGKIVQVKGGPYGWKIDTDAESKALMENIKLGEIFEKEPLYLQKAFSRDGNEIGNTYVEINITRQRLWFYKDGRLIVQGAVVTGNPNKGNSTKVGVFMLNYKQKDTILRGADYEAEVTYWMPFYGNMGIHDASWRHVFGGEIYKRNGTHGCVNVPLYIAKKIFDNIEDGTPIISYEE
ncbi:L,D-transpeptidase family protein [Clostridium thermarum]|uniref:L,D-transpeptidase family protein n=1 Tax=Clostridium thermarum TaxID=1716543 RepID=UPI0013D0470C|nr:L,D-transpeptidase family protein [Clostridium thermarum]